MMIMHTVTRTNEKRTRRSSVVDAQCLLTRAGRGVAVSPRLSVSQTGSVSDSSMSRHTAAGRAGAGTTPYH